MADISRGLDKEPSLAKIMVNEFACFLS